ncbi:MAG: HypC/HybG/HupF family hydrogenase formation chaperone [Candidatus Hecatellaceae archaeon]|nr:MAG: HypC/HybG/HupF family hydrogenase formation chaperone [Candidatus Hecatellales archaeon]
MCLAIPAKVLEVSGSRAKVDFGGGVTREVNVSLLEKVKVGDYVIVHAGFAIQILDSEEAEKTLKLWEEVLEAGFEGGSHG